MENLKRSIKNHKNWFMNNFVSLNDTIKKEKKKKSECIEEKNIME